MARPPSRTVKRDRDFYGRRESAKEYADSVKGAETRNRYYASDKYREVLKRNNISRRSDPKYKRWEALMTIARSESRSTGQPIKDVMAKWGVGPWSVHQWVMDSKVPTRTLGTRGEQLIKHFEMLRLQAYRPIPSDPWTIGWGHTRTAHEGMTITKTQAERLFREDVLPVERAVSSIQTALTSSMSDAIISLCFNVGTSAINANSTIGRALRAGGTGGYIRAWRAFSLWTATPGAELGLSRRRSAEMALFLEDGWPR